MKHFIILITQLVLCLSALAQDLAIRIAEGERLMERAMYAEAKHQFELALTEAKGANDIKDSLELCAPFQTNTKEYLEYIHPFDNYNDMIYTSIREKTWQIGFNPTLRTFKIDSNIGSVFFWGGDSMSQRLKYLFDKSLAHSEQLIIYLKQSAPTDVIAKWSYSFVEDLVHVDDRASAMNSIKKTNLGEKI